MGCDCKEKICEIEKIESLTGNIIEKETQAIIKKLIACVESQSHAIKASVIAAYLQGVYDAKEDDINKI